jgi:hypothetical protein
MIRTIINIAIISGFALGASTLVGCKDKREHESTMNKQPVTSEATPGALGEASGVSGAVSGPAVASGSGS